MPWNPAGSLRGAQGPAGVSTLRGASDYDDSGGAPTSARAGMLWIPSSGKWAPRDVLLASDYGVANGVAELDGSGLLPATRLPAIAVTSDQRAPIGGASASTLSVAQTYALDATGAPVRRFTLTASPTLAVPTGGVDGQRISLWLLASGAARTFTFASGYEVSPAVPSRSISIASGTWELIDIECRAGTWRLARTDQLLFAPSDIGAAASGHAHTASEVGAAAALATLRRWRSGSQTGLTNASVQPIVLNALDSSVSRGTGLSESGNGIAVAGGGVCLVTYEVLFQGSTSGSRAVTIAVNGLLARNGEDVPGTTVRTSGAALISVPNNGVVTLNYYVTGSPTLGGSSAADTGMSVTRLIA